MPWEIDHAHVVFVKLRSAMLNIDKDSVPCIQACLNLSDSIINWNESKLPKEYFVDRYTAIKHYFQNLCETKFSIYNGSGVYGHLDLQRESMQDNIDCYITMCPDMDFNEYLISHFIESAKLVNNKYFVITPQIFKCWDSSWDDLVNERFKSLPYEKCLSKNSDEIVKLQEDVKISKLGYFKFAGWLDLYSKDFYEKLVPVLPEWHGYGPWDLYAMNVCNLARRFGEDVQQYVLENQVIWFHDSGELRNENEYGGTGKLKIIYNSYVKKNINRQSQRMKFDLDMSKLINNWHKYYEIELKNKV